MPPSNTRSAGELHLSGTRDATYIEECERKWAWQHIAGHTTEETEAHRFGSRFHRVGELYLGHRKQPDRSTPEGALYLTGVHLWPAPTNPSAVEQPFEVPAPGHEQHGQKFTGTKDYVKAVELVFPGFPASRGLPGVGDYKTTKSIDAYAPSPEKLRKGTQFTSYLHHEISKHGARAGAGRWVYYDKSVRRKAHAVDVVITREDAASEWHRHEDAMGRMVALWQAKANPLELRPRGRDTQDWEACDRYGGCPFKRLCVDKYANLNVNDMDPGDFVGGPKKPGAPEMSTGTNSKLFAKFAIAGVKKPEPVAPAPVEGTPPPEASEAELEAAFEAANGESEIADEAPSINPAPVPLTPEQEALVKKHEAEVATAVAAKAAAKAPKAKPIASLKAAPPPATIEEKREEEEVKPALALVSAAKAYQAATASTLGAMLDQALAGKAASADQGELSEQLQRALERIDELEGKVSRLASLFRDI